MMENLFPLIGQEGILMNIFKDLDLISTSINIESILISDKSMISPCLRHLVSFIVWLPNLVPLFFLYFILEQIVEIGATFSRIATEEEEAIPIRDGPCA